MKIRYVCESIAKLNIIYKKKKKLKILYKLLKSVIKTKYFYESNDV